MSGAENVSVLKYVSGSHESSISRCLVNQVENVSGQKMSEWPICLSAENVSGLKMHHVSQIYTGPRWHYLNMI
jgi:hypothetical protein